MKKKLICLVLCFVMAVSLSATAFADESDVSLNEQSDATALSEANESSTLDDSTETGEEISADVSYVLSEFNDNPSTLFSQGNSTYAAAATDQDASEIIQNKNNWCWATAAGMVGNRYNSVKKLARTLSTNARVTLTSTDNVRYNYIGYNNGALAAHGAQRSIVVNQKNGSDADAGGSDANKIAGIKFAGNATSVYSIGSAYDGSIIRSKIATVNSSLAKRYWVIGNVYVSNGHSLVLSEHRTSDNYYWVYDPWTGSGGYKSYNVTFSSGFSTVIGTSSVKWVQYIA